MDNMPTRHAEIGAINALSFKGRQPRLLKKTTLVVIRFIEPPPAQKWKSKKSKKKYKKRNRYNDHSGDEYVDGDDKNKEFSLTLACSRPCIECIKIIRALQLKSVIYVNDNGKLVNESPHDIDDTVHSGGTLGVIEKRTT